MLAEPAHSVVHGLGEFPQVTVDLGGTGVRNPAGPRPKWLWHDAVEPVADPGVQDAGDVAGAGHTPHSYRLAENIAAVEPGQFGFAQAAPQPAACRVVQRFLGQVGGQGAAQRAFQPGVLFAADQVVPDSAEHAQVVGAGQFPFQGLRCRQFSTVTG